METKYSKKPWSYEKTVIKGLVSIVDSEGTEIGQITDSGSDEETLEANMKLISAAPDLLEALKGIIPFAEQWINANHPNHKAAIAAIKKATE